MKGDGRGIIKDQTRTVAADVMTAERNGSIHPRSEKDMSGKVKELAAQLIRNFNDAELGAEASPRLSLRVASGFDT